MGISVVCGGTIHDLPDDMHAVLVGDADVLSKRNNLTPLARNERICRVTIVKKEKTRANHLVRLVEDIIKAKKRPCCRPGCPHHRVGAEQSFR